MNSDNDVSQKSGSTHRMNETDRVVIDIDEAERIANSLEMMYERTKQSAYDGTDRQSAMDAMMIRERAGIKPNPDLLNL